MWTGLISKTRLCFFQSEIQNEVDIVILSLQ
jgi:hypothetical protein